MSSPESDVYALDAPANVFIGTVHGGPGRRRVLWTLTAAGAQRVCGDHRTRGQDSALFWNYLSGEGPRGGTWDYVADDGRYAAVLAELGVAVLGSAAAPYQPPAP